MLLLLEDGCDAYPELVEELVWAPSLNESQMFVVDEMFTFVTIASLNRGLNLGIWGSGFVLPNLLKFTLLVYNFHVSERLAIIIGNQSDLLDATSMI